MSKLTTRLTDSVLTITLDDPPANTYSYEMMQELDTAILAVRMDADVHVIVITGAGDKFFCAGANIGMLKDADPAFKYYLCLVGKARAIEMMATGTLFSFEDAREIGLVNHVWGDADLNGRTFAAAIHDYARQFTPPNKAAKAVGHIKRAVQSGLESGCSEGLALERELQQRLFESGDAKDGLNANFEKRKPNFSGR